jgi:hypothetical protein
MGRSALVTLSVRAAVAAPELAEETENVVLPHPWDDADNELNSKSGSATVTSSFISIMVFDEKVKNNAVGVVVTGVSKVT